MRSNARRPRGTPAADLGSGRRFHWKACHRAAPAPSRRKGKRVQDPALGAGIVLVVRPEGGIDVCFEATSRVRRFASDASL